MKNLIAFFEIPVTDFYESVNFYQAIFGVELMVANTAMRKWLVLYRTDKQLVQYPMHLTSNPQSMAY